MPTREEMMFKNADFIMVVNKDFEIVYNSRFDTKMGNSPYDKPYKNLFEMYPSLGKNNSSIVKTMSTGETIFRDAQEFADKKGRVYVTQNLTVPLFREGKIVGAVELTKDLTTAGHVEGKKEYLKNLSRESGFHPNRENNEKITFDDILTLNEDLLNTIEQAKVFAFNPNPTLIYYAAGPKQKIIVQNCAAVPENLIESILFGTTRGSYTGA